MSLYDFSQSQEIFARTGLRHFCMRLDDKHSPAAVCQNENSPAGDAGGIYSFFEAESIWPRRLGACEHCEVVDDSHRSRVPAAALEK